MAIGITYKLSNLLGDTSRIIRGLMYFDWTANDTLADALNIDPVLCDGLLIQLKTMGLVELRVNGLGMLARLTDGGRTVRRGFEEGTGLYK